MKKILTITLALYVFRSYSQQYNTTYRDEYGNIIMNSTTTPVNTGTGGAAVLGTSTFDPTQYWKHKQQQELLLYQLKLQQQEQERQKELERQKQEEERLNRAPKNTTSEAQETQKEEHVISKISWSNQSIYNK